MSFWDKYHNQIVAVAMLVLALAVIHIVRGFLNRKIDKTRDRFFVQVFKYLNGPVYAFCVITALYITSRQFYFSWLHDSYAYKGFTLVITALVTWFAVRLVQLASALLLRRFNTDTRDNLNARMMHTQVRVLRRLAIAIILIIGAASGLMVFEQIRALGVSLLASAGVAGIVLGFAAQRTIGNFFTGLQIAITQPIRIDDAVVVQGEWGWIEEINLTYVVVRIWDQRRLVLPITWFVENPFQNWTRTSADILGSVILYLDYTMPVQPLREELDRLLEGNEMWDGRAKVVQVTDTSERTMTVRILVSAADSPTAWELRCFIREKLIEFIQKNYPEQLPRLRAELPDNLPPKREAA